MQFLLSVDMGATIFIKSLCLLKVAHIDGYKKDLMFSLKETELLFY